MARTTARLTFIVTFALTLGLIPSSGWAQRGSKASSGEGQLHALLLNGGGSPKINFLSHLHHLEDMMALLLERGVPKENISVFSADGEAPAPDLMTATGRSQKNFWLLGGSGVEKHFKSNRKIENTVWKGVKLHPARYGKLRRWFKKKAKGLSEGDTLLLFVTDHGKGGKNDPDNGSIVLWDEEMNVAELRALTSHLKPGVRVVSVMSQCFSGTFASSIYPMGEELPDGESCGFYSTRNDRLAYGCYPEGRGKEQIGHAFQFIDALRENDSLKAAHRQVLVQDDTPDVPLTSSDLFLSRRVKAESDAQHVDLETVADELVSMALRSPHDHAESFALIDSIARAYGLSSHRSVATINKELEATQKIIDSADKSQKSWRGGQDGLLRSNWQRFIDDKKYGPIWAARMKEKALKGMKKKPKQAILTKLLPDLAKFTRASGAMATLKTMRAAKSGAAKSKYRMEIRMAMLLRMRHALLSVAGRALLMHPSTSLSDARRRDARRVLDKLETCEETAPGTAAGTSRPFKPKPLPSLMEEVKSVRSRLPSRLGIGYEAAQPELIAQKALGGGAVAVNRVLKGSAAAKAGLRVGDLVTGHTGGLFQYRDHIRHWVMTSPNDRDVRVLVIRGGKKLNISVRLDPIEVDLPTVSSDLREGKAVPAFTMPGQVSAPRNAPYLLFFWSSWSSESQKALEEVVKWGAATGVEIIAISDDPPAQLRAFRLAWRGALPAKVLTDPGREVFSVFKVNTAPTMVLVDKDGIVRFIKRGHKLGKKVRLPKI